LFLYKRAARIVSVTHSFRDTLMRRGIDGAKIDVVTNGVDIGRFSPRPKDLELEASLDFQGCFVVGYIGTHGMAHALHTLLEAMVALQANPESAHVRLLMLGDGAEKARLQDQAKLLGLTCVRFVDTVPKEQVARYWSLLDVSVIHLRDTELFETVIPSKLFECMGMGIPVLLGVAGESARIVEMEGIGIVFPPEGADALTKNVLALYHDVDRRESMRRRCIAAADKYDRRALALQMRRCLLKAASSIYLRS
jgi:glycosyltransferase involved in cell wall biosynthesis